MFRAIRGLLTPSSITVTLLLALLLASAGWLYTSVRLNEEIANRRADKEAFKSAQEAAKVKSLQEKARIEKEYHERAKEADDNYRDLLDRYNAYVLQYSYESSSGDFNLSISSGSSEGVDGPGPPPVFSVSVPVTDLYICADNTARLQAARAWALSLNK